MSSTTLPQEIEDIKVEISMGHLAKLSPSVQTELDRVLNAPANESVISSDESDSPRSETQSATTSTTEPSSISSNPEKDDSLYYYTWSVSCPPLTLGTGTTIPTQFKPRRSNETPQTLFPPEVNIYAGAPSMRFISKYDNSQFLIFTDGACTFSHKKAGWSFVFKPFNPDSPSTNHVSRRLELKGPTGWKTRYTANRAELRAVLSAIRYRDWSGEGFKTLVIATDSQYVAEGSTKWIKTWLKNGWIKRDGDDVRNQDLWKCLLGEIERCNSKQLRIKFWWIPRSVNTEADYYAKSALSDSFVEEFVDVQDDTRP